MATATVSGSVDVNVKRLAGMHIKSQGLTANEVIKRTWENIARTGEVPFADEGSHRAKGSSSAFNRLLELRKGVPAGTPLDTMGAAELKHELETRDV